MQSISRSVDKDIVKRDHERNNEHYNLFDDIYTRLFMRTTAERDKGIIQDNYSCILDLP